MEETGETVNKMSAASAGDASENVSEATAEGPSRMSESAAEKSTSQCDNKKAHHGDRLKLFNKVIEKSLQRFIDDASFHRFAQSFQPFNKDKQLMEKIHKQFTEQLQCTIQGEIDSLVEEGDFNYKLNELDKLEQAAKDNKESAWRPSGVPDQDLSCFVLPYYKKQNNYLLRELKKIQEENAALAERVQAGRDRITHTSQHIATAVDEWKASVSETQMLNSSGCHGDTFDV